MGKTLIVKGANFYQNCIDTVEPSQIYCNLINPEEITQEKYINDKGNIANAGVNKEYYAISGYIPVNGKNIYCPTEYMIDTSDSGSFGGYLVYDGNKELIRFERRRKKQYTYEDGDAYVIFPLRNDSLNNPTLTDGFSYPQHFASYGDGALPYVPYEES